MNDESLLLASLSFCFVMVVLATSAGFSAALGAFVMGSILAETPSAEKIEHLVAPLKNLFGAVFFVSVGMLIDPKMLWLYAGPVALLTAVVIIGKTVNVTAGSLASGQPLRQSLQSGMSMAQIGEFSFIIAALGQSLHVTSDFLYPIAVGVSVITTFSTPFTMRLADPAHLWLERKLPERWLRVINRYSSGAQSITTKSQWRQAVRSYFSLILINTALVLGIILISSLYLFPLLKANIESRTVARFISLIITIVAMAPFLWALTVKRIDSVSYRMLWLDKKYNKGPLVVMALMRVLLGILLVGFLLDQFYTVNVALAAGVAVFVIVLIIFSKRLKAFYHRIEERFLHNFHEKERGEVGSATALLIPWDAHLASYEIVPEADFVGKTLAELHLRESLGVNIARILRGDLMIYAPGREERLYPGDKIEVIGTDVQLEEFGRLLKESVIPPAERESVTDITLQQINVDRHFPFHHMTIRESQIRELTQGLVVGIERNGERILNPESTTVFTYGDTVWMVGSKAKILAVLRKR